MVNVLVILLLFNFQILSESTTLLDPLVSL